MLIKHGKQEELKYARNELEILNKVEASPPKKNLHNYMLSQMKESPVILDLEEYFESGLQSVILTEYLEVRRLAALNHVRQQICLHKKNSKI